jgi:hypothetical protein
LVFGELVQGSEASTVKGAGNGEGAKTVEPRTEKAEAAEAGT